MPKENDIKNDEIIVNKSLDAAFALTIAAIKASDLEYIDKRDLLYSCLIWQCIYYDTFNIEPHPILNEFNCLAEPEPQKFQLYEFVLNILKLNTSDLILKAEWYINFTYLAYFGAANSEKEYDELTEILFCAQVFDAALVNQYSIFIPVTIEDMHEKNLPAPVINWLTPYINYINEADDDGMSRMHLYLRTLLKQNDNEMAFARTEMLLDCCPLDEEFRIINVAARAGLFKDKRDDVELINSTLALTESFIADNTARKVYFMYYRALTLIALMRVDEAKQQFKECLELDNKFMLAELMLRALK